MTRILRFLTPCSVLGIALGYMALISSVIHPWLAFAIFALGVGSFIASFILMAIFWKE